MHQLFIACQNSRDGDGWGSLKRNKRKLMEPMVASLSLDKGWIKGI